MLIRCSFMLLLSHSLPFGCYCIFANVNVSIDQLVTTPDEIAVWDMPYLLPLTMQHKSPWSFSCNNEHASGITDHLLGSAP